MNYSIYKLPKLKKLTNIIINDLSSLISVKCLFLKIFDQRQYGDYLKLKFKKANLYFCLIFKRVVFVLKNLSFLNFKNFIDLTALDKINLKFKQEFFCYRNRYDVFYILCNIKNSNKLILSLDWNFGEKIYTIMDLYKAADWCEREVWDMFGIYFINHKNLRKILTDYGFVGFPLRKDFPVVGFFEVRYDEEISSIIYDKVTLSQENRLFEVMRPWSGTGGFIKSKI